MYGTKSLKVLTFYLFFVVFLNDIAMHHYSDNGVVLLIICGVSALALILVMGVVMKIKLKKDQGKNSVCSI